MLAVFHLTMQIVRLFIVPLSDAVSVP